MAQKKLLLFDKVIARGKKHQSINGAERFNLCLAAQLQECGVDVTIVGSRGWEADINRISDKGSLEVIWMPEIFRVAWPNVFLSFFSLAKRRFDTLLLGNVGHTTLPTVLLLHSLGCFSHCVLMAHREPTPIFLRLLKLLPIQVVAVNHQIADHFKRAGFNNVEVYFGEINHERFLPSLEEKKSDGFFHFAVFGSLDSEWKGADTAIEAFMRLPEHIKSKSKLHLASFAHTNPNIEHPSIIKYSWMDEADVPEFLRSLDVLLVPSRDEGVMRETFSQAMVQGMLCGLPLIVNDLPILKEKVEDGGGLVFKNIDELVSHMIRLFENKSERKKLSESAIKAARDRYCWNSSYFVKRFLPQPV